MKSKQPSRSVFFNFFDLLLHYDIFCLTKKNAIDWFFLIDIKKSLGKHKLHKNCQKLHKNFENDLRQPTLSKDTV